MGLPKLIKTIIIQFLYIILKIKNKVKKMIKKIIIMFFFVSVLFAKDDYSEMSNEELIAIIGYVKIKDKDKFEKELSSRIPSMNEKEKELYNKNKEKLENGKK